MTRYGPGGHVRKYRPPIGSGNPRLSGGRLAEPRSVRSPDEVRKAWLDLCGLAVRLGRDPETPPEGLEAARAAAVEAGPFPLPAGEVRTLVAATAAEQLRLYAMAANADVRRAVAPVILAGAGMLEALLREQGAAIAAAARARMGQRDD